MDKTDRNLDKTDINLDTIETNLKKLPSPNVFKKLTLSRFDLAKLWIKQAQYLDKIREKGHGLALNQFPSNHADGSIFHQKQYSIQLHLTNFHTCFWSFFHHCEFYTGVKV